jgi:hypothetical protein
MRKSALLPRPAPADASISAVQDFWRHAPYIGNLPGDIVLQARKDAPRGSPEDSYFEAWVLDDETGAQSWSYYNNKEGTKLESPLFFRGVPSKTWI